MYTNNKMTTTTSEINKGYLELIVGPMFSGKTSRLIDIYKQCKFCNIPVAVINHSEDTRYDNILLSNHDKIMIPCIQTRQLADIWLYNQETIPIAKTLESNYINQLLDAQVILINEGQFFNDLYSCVESMLLNSKKVYICGLDGDFERKKFGQMLDLVPLCDKITKLTSLCSICKNGTPGIFSMRLTVEKCQTLVGSDNYIPVCRKCYENKNNNYKKL
jgi:thymidine kinase